MVGDGEHDAKEVTVYETSQEIWNELKKESCLR